MQVTLKRDGREVSFDKTKIENAIKKAFIDVDGCVEPEAEAVASKIASEIENIKKQKMSVEEIQDIVENKLMQTSRKDVARAYIIYRNERNLARQRKVDEEVLQLINNDKESYWAKENSNKDSQSVTVQRDYLAGILSTDIARKYIFPKDVMKAHDAGIVHQHDMDYMAQATLHNCDVFNLEDMLQNDTVVNNVRINKPHRLITAMTITTQIMASVASSQYGGQSISLTHLAPFVRDSYKIHLKKYKDAGLGHDICEKLARIDLNKEIEDAVQTFNYQASTLFTLNGQAPFCSVFMYLNEAEEYKEELAMLISEFFKQRVEGMPNRDGVKVTQAFPKLLYVLEEDNYKPNTKYWYLTQQAIDCSSKRLTPDYMSEKIMKEMKNGCCFPVMGCRSALSYWEDPETHKPKFYGRWNGGVNSINLPYIAMLAEEVKKDDEETEDIFFKLLNQYCEIAHKGLKIRAERLARTKAKVAPILWMDGALSRKQPEDTLEDMVYGGYMTSSLGFVGLYETVLLLTGESQTGTEGNKMALKILQRLNDKCEEWKSVDNIGYSVYSTPAESLAYKFATKTKDRFPEKFKELFGNKKYFENSYHIPSFEEIDPFTKIIEEGKLQRLSPGGCLSYIESVDLSNNVEALYPVLECIYDNIMYCEINMKTSYCHVCNCQQTIDVHKDDNGDTWWECAQCGNKDTEKMDVAARTCGYIGTNFWNDGKTQEIASRYINLDDHEL